MYNLLCSIVYSDVYSPQLSIYRNQQQYISAIKIFNLQQKEERREMAMRKQRVQLAPIDSPTVDGYFSSLLCACMIESCKILIH